MKKTIIFMLLGFLLAGCSGQKGVISFQPIEPYKPNSGAELLGELNSQLPFKISDKNFICKYSSNSETLTGWFITKTTEQKDIAKERLEQSSTLKILQVELLSPEMKEIFKNNWKQSQTMVPPE